MRRLVRWLVRGALAVLALAVLAIAVVLIAIHTDRGRNLVRAQVVEALHGAFPGGVAIAHLDGSVFGTLSLRGVELDGRDHLPWITVGRIDVRVSLWPLLARTVRIDSLVIDDVAIDQHAQPPAPPEPPEPEGPHEPSPWTIEIGHVEVHHASARIATDDHMLDFHDVDVNAAATLDRGALTALFGLRGHWADRDIAATGIAHLGDGTISVPFAAAKVGKAHARVLGLRLGDVVEGVAAAFVPAVAAEAVAQLHLPGDVAVVASAAEDGALDVHGALGDATVRAIGLASAQTRTANALVIADVPDGSRFGAELAGRAQLTAALTARPGRVRGMVAIAAVRPLDKELLGKDAVASSSLVALDASPAGAWLVIESGLDVGEGHARAIAELARGKDGAVTVTKSSLLASASRIGERTAEAHVGYLFASANASGPLLPKPSLELRGTLEGAELRYGTLSVASVAAAVDTHHLTRANAHLDVGKVQVGARPLGSASLDVRVARDAGGTIDIAIDKHSIATAQNGTWSGSGGRIRIEPARIVVENVHTGTGGGDVVANALLDRASSNLHATVTAKDLALATLQPGAGGTLGATVAVDRRGGRWSGTAQVQGRGVAVHGQAPLDVDLALAVAGRRVQATTTATAPEGKVTVAADLDGPYDFTDGAAWKRLERSSLRELSVAVDHLDLGKLGATGTIAGALSLTGTGASGDLALRGVVTNKGIVDADLALGPDTRGPLGLLAQVKAQLEGVETATADAQLELPVRPFDPAQWQALGRRVLHHASVALAPLDFDPAVLARAHVDAPYSGHLEATVDVSEGAGSVTAAIDATKLRGGAIVQPVELHAQAAIDERGAHVTGDVAASGKPLVTLEAAAPIAIDRIADALAHPVAPLTGTIAIPKVAAQQVVAVLGRRDVSSGVVDGTVALGGTIGKPTADLALTASGVTIPASIAGRPPARLEWLQIAGRWDGVGGELAISGREQGGGRLALAAQGRPDQLKAFTATVTATKFDIAPLVAFAAGAVSAARGTFDAKLTLLGLDATTGDVNGELDIHDGRLPISPLLGTLRSTTAHVAIANHQVDATISAKLGKGDLKGTAKVALVGSSPAKANANLVLHQISLVRALQPTIDATLDATFTHDAHATAWHGDVAVHHGHVLVATTGGVALLPSDAPSDMQFTDRAPEKLAPLLQRPPPEKPWLFANVSLDNTGIDVVQDEFQVRGSVAGSINLSLGDGVGMDGTVEATTQNIELLGARAQLDHATVTWDGTLDPMLDIAVLRELTDLTITANVTGRLSKPQISLSSDSGSYTQGELIGYFLGGTPSADRGDVTQTAAAAGAGAASALVTSQLRKVLPGSVAKFAQRVTFNYEVATSSSSEALRVGYWISKHVLVAVRNRLEPLPDENANEGIGEWHFRSNMMLQGSAGDRGVAGLDLVRRWRW